MHSLGWEADRADRGPDAFGAEIAAADALLRRVLLRDREQSATAFRPRRIHLAPPAE